MKLLERFLEAQEPVWEEARDELKAGFKQGHWMWFIFPQLKGLGYSEMAQFFAIENLQEAKDYLAHPILGQRLTDLCHILLQLPETDATSIFGPTDALKLRSSMTLFHVATGQPASKFLLVIEKFYNHKQDLKTLELLEFG